MEPYVWGVDHETEDTYLTLGTGIEQNSLTAMEDGHEQDRVTAMVDGYEVWDDGDARAEDPAVPDMFVSSAVPLDPYDESTIPQDEATQRALRWMKSVHPALAAQLIRKWHMPCEEMFPWEAEDGYSPPEPGTWGNVILARVQAVIDLTAY
jgi:hypothetical protein